METVEISYYAWYYYYCYTLCKYFYVNLSHIWKLYLHPICRHWL